MDDTITFDQLLERYRSERERETAEPPLETAARVLAWAGEQQAADLVADSDLVSKACQALARDGIPPELGLSPRTATLIERHERPPCPELGTSARPEPRLIEPDRTALLAAGLVERDRSYSLYWDVAEGRRSLRDLTRAEYDEFQISEAGGSGGLIIWSCGWIPAGIVAIVAGIVVAFISGDWRLFVATALGGAIVGYLAAIAAMFAYLEVDTRWLRLGQQVGAASVILLATGSAVALLVAVLVLNSDHVPAYDGIVHACRIGVAILIFWWAWRTMR